MTTYRTGNHWGVTIVREAVDRSNYSPCRACQSGAETGHDCHPHDRAQLVAVVVNGDQALAERICELLNGEGEVAEPQQHGATRRCADCRSVFEPYGDETTCRVCT